MASARHRSEQRRWGAQPPPQDRCLTHREMFSRDLGQCREGTRRPELGGWDLEGAVSGERLWYLRSQGLHENERFSDVARMFLPGAAVVLFLATHLLQSGSRERCEEEEEERGD